jgi:hypothetical protein
MANSIQVLGMLIPDGGYVQTGTEFEDIEFLECEPITKKQFEDGFAAYDAWKAQQDADKAATKAELLNRLGITADEAALLLG